MLGRSSPALSTSTRDGGGHGRVADLQEGVSRQLVQAGATADHHIVGGQRSDGQGRVTDEQLG